MSAIAIERPRERATSVRRGIGRGALFLLVLATLWGMWEGYRALWIHEHWTWPFVVDNTTMPHLHDIVHALFRPARFQGPLLISVLLKAAAFTAKEAAIGFAMGAAAGFALGVVLAHSASFSAASSPTSSRPRPFRSSSSRRWWSSTWAAKGFPAGSPSP